MHEGFQDPAVPATTGETAPNAANPHNPREPLDAAKRDLIVTLVRLGGSRRMAAREVGCAASTITRIAARDPQFAARLDEAESKSDRKALEIINRAQDQEKYWRAAAWVLERRNPEEYGRRTPHTYTADQVMRLVSRIVGTLLPAVPDNRRGEVLLEFNDTLAELEAAAAQSKAPSVGANVAIAEGSLPIAEAEAIRYSYWQRTEEWFRSLDPEEIREVGKIAIARAERHGTHLKYDSWFNLLTSEGMRREGFRKESINWEKVAPEPAAESDEDWSETDAMQHPVAMGG
jgi:hypothetical protein